MLEQALLADRFQLLLARQQQAARAYTDLAAVQNDSALCEQLRQLSLDKQRHVHLTERLLEIVQ
ncbi:MAG: hypothetical protein SVT52_07980 [Planctomycetota bacterium]|nr:hypothetical protein [Planctomycetota bacterium]